MLFLLSFLSFLPASTCWNTLARCMWCGSGILKPQNAVDGSHQWRDSLRRFSVRVAPFRLASDQRPVPQSAEEIRLRFVRLWRKLVDFPSKTERGQLDLWQGFVETFLQVVSARRPLLRSPPPVPLGPSWYRFVY